MHSAGTAEGVSFPPHVGWQTLLHKIPLFSLKMNFLTLFETRKNSGVYCCKVKFWNKLVVLLRLHGLKFILTEYFSCNTMWFF